MDDYVKTWQVKQDLCHALPAPRINSAMKTDLSHRGQISAPPHLGLNLAVAAVAKRTINHSIKSPNAL